MKRNRYAADILVEKSNPNLRYLELVTKSRAYKRSSVKFRETKNSIRFSISAADATALKATLNSIMGELSVVESVLKAKIPQKQKRQTL